jgi:hypothetical protein
MPDQDGKTVHDLGVDGAADPTALSFCRSAFVTAPAASSMKTAGAASS